MKRLALLSVFLALPFMGCAELFGLSDDNTPEDFLFFVDVEARLIGGTPGVQGFVEVTCSPLGHDSCNGSCIYKLEVDGFSHGSTLTGTRFSLVLPSDPVEYGFRCTHEPSGSHSDTAYLLVP